MFNVSIFGLIYLTHYTMMYTRTCAVCNNAPAKLYECVGCQLRLYCVSSYLSSKLYCRDIMEQGVNCRKEDWVDHKPFCETARTIPNWPRERKSLWCELIRFIADNMTAVCYLSYFSRVSC